MKTNFFATIAPFLGSMNLTFTVAKDGADTVIVSLLPQPKIKDNAKESVQPMIIRGTVEELDEQFFEAIKVPMTKVTGIVIEIENFEKGADKLAEDNKAKDAIKAEAKKNKEKVDKIIVKGNELLESGDLVACQKKLDEAIKLAPGTTNVNKLMVALEAAQPVKEQVDLFEAIAEAPTKVEKPIVTEILPESPNELEIENNRIFQGNTMRDEEIEAFQQEMDDRYNVGRHNNVEYES
jgi:PRTRC genetic system protein E